MRRSSGQDPWEQEWYHMSLGFLPYYSVLVAFCQSDTNIDACRKGILKKKMSPKDWPIAKSLRYYPD